MTRTKEVAFNALLAEELIARHPRWDHGSVTAEATDVLVGTPAKSPDIVVGHPGGGVLGDRGDRVRPGSHGGG